MQVSPTYSMYWTVKEIERELEGLVFKGAGLYCTYTDTVLVTPILGEPNGESFWKEESNLYQVDVYNCPYKDTVFSVLNSVPLY